MRAFEVPIQTNKKSWAMWGLVSLFYMYEVVLRVSPTVMTQELMGAFHVSSFELGFLASCFYYAYVLLQLPCGLILDKLGVRRLVTLSALLSAVGALLFAHADTLIIAQIGRLLIGSGAACGFISCLKVGMEWFSPLHFALIPGLSTMMGTLGGTFAGRPLASVVTSFGWKNTMVGLSYLGFVVALVCWIFLRDSRVFFKDQFPPLSQALKIFSRHPKLWGIGLVGGLMYLPISVFAELWGVPFLMNAYGISKELASTTSTMVFVGLALGGPGMALFQKYGAFSHKAFLQGASFLSAVFFFLVAFTEHVPLVFIFILLFLVGFLIGAQSLCFAWSKEHMPPSMGGTTVAFTNALVMLLGAIFQPLIGGILDFFWDGTLDVAGVPIYSIDAYQKAIMTIPLCLVLSGFVLFFLKKNQRPPTLRIFMLRLTNTISGQKEAFSPLDPSHVRLYVCGPTVYERAHIGNARSVVVFDLLFRLLQTLFPRVTYVRNITDIDDKIIEACHTQGVSLSDLTTQMTSFFHQDMASLNTLSPTYEPKATEHLEMMFKMILNLLEKGHAYISKSHVLFNVESCASYGHLSSKKNLMAGARIEIASYKKNPHDFVLWKPASKNEIGWESPFGRGRPGWHIECSAMSLTYLGVPFDIHGGGIDLVFPHHENEIAQTCSATGRDCMAKVWVHNGHLSVEGQKMSKSLGNFKTVHDLTKTWPPEVLRLALLSTHYHQPLNWTDNLLHQAQKNLTRWKSVVQTRKPGPCPPLVLEALFDDMNTPKAIFKIHQIANNYFKTQNPVFADQLYQAGVFLGIFSKQQSTSLDEKISCLIRKRYEARMKKDFETSDKLRQELLDLGIILEDSKTETTWRCV